MLGKLSHSVQVPKFSQGEEEFTQEDNGNLIFNTFSHYEIFHTWTRKKIYTLSVPPSNLPVGFLGMQLLLL